MSTIEELKARAAREAMTIAELARAPIVEVVGLVESGPRALHQVGGEVEWRLRTAFSAWRVAGGRLERSPLSLLRMGDQAALSQLRGCIEADSILRVQTRFWKEREQDSPSALLWSVMGPAEDEELGELRTKALQPLVYEDPTFGALAFDRTLDWFRGKTRWGRREVRLNIKARDLPGAKRAAMIAHELWQNQSTWNARVADFAVEKLLPVKNESWREPGARPVSAQTFKRRIKLRSISVLSAERIEFAFDDGDLFYGHSICVRASLAQGPIDASL